MSEYGQGFVDALCVAWLVFSGVYKLKLLNDWRKKLTKDSAGAPLEER